MRNMLFLFGLLYSCCIYSQESQQNSVITVSAIANSKENAVSGALRNALEQTYGMFISSNTTLINDKVIRDEITSISNGNIQSFEIINQEQFKNGSIAITLRAVVSISNLVKFIKSKGFEVEVSGGLFAQNIKQKQLNETAELNAVYNLVSILHENLQSSFDYKIVSGEPIAINNDNKKWEVPLFVHVIANENIESCRKYLHNSLLAISLSKEEIDSYLQLGKNVYPFPLLNNNDNTINVFYLRNEQSQKMLELVLNQTEFYLRRYVIENGITQYNGVGDLAMYDNLVVEKDFYYYFFLNKSDTAALVNFNEQLSLNQLEKINKYSVKPNPEKSFIKNGGLVFFEDSLKGYVVSLFDIGAHSLNEAVDACKNLTLFGYTDWILPNRDDIFLMAKNLEDKKLGGFIERGLEVKSTNLKAQQPSMLGFYWNSYNPRKGTGISTNSNIVGFDAEAYWFNPNDVKKVRAIRRYSLNGEPISILDSNNVSEDVAKLSESTPAINEYEGVYEFNKNDDFKIIIIRNKDKYGLVLKYNKKNQTVNDIVQEKMDFRALGYRYYTIGSTIQEIKKIEKDVFQIPEPGESILSKKSKLIFNRDQNGSISGVSYITKNGDNYTSINTIRL